MTSKNPDIFISICSWKQRYTNIYDYLLVILKNQI